MKAETSPESKSLFADWLKLQTFSDPQLEKLVGACQEWAGAFKNHLEPRWLSICGTSGSGKTHCATKLFNWAYKRSDWRKTAYLPAGIYWPSFVEELRGGNAFERRADIQKWPVLFLDDVGAERDTTGFATESLNTLLGCRIGRWTIITSNMTIDQLEAKDSRIASRIVRPPNICVGVITQDYATRETQTP